MQRLINYMLMFSIVLLVSFTAFSVMTLETVSADSDTDIPEEIQDILDQDPSEVSVEQFQQVQDWFIDNGEQLPEEEYNELGSWIGQASSADLDSEDDPVQTVDTDTESVVIEINDNLTVNDYEFDDDTVNVTITSNQNTESIVLTDPNSVDGSSGSGSVNQQGVTVPGGSTIEVSMDVQSAFGGSQTVWISAGAEQTVYLSNDREQLLDRVTTWMLGIVFIGAVISVFTNILAVVYIKYKRVKTQYSNLFDQI